MLLTKTIQKAEKLSGQTIQKTDYNMFFVNYKGYSVSFHANGRIEEGTNSTGFYTKKHGQEDDYQSDYFAGTFHDNITQAFRFIDRMVPFYFTPDPADRITWEEELIYQMELVGEMTTSDAQGQLMIREDLADDLFSKFIIPAVAAQRIIDSCTVTA